MRGATLRMAAFFASALLFVGNLPAQSVGNLPHYAPRLPQVKAKATEVDPKKGYAVKELKPDVFMITDGAYESVFVTTGKGMVLLDSALPDSEEEWSELDSCSQWNTRIAVQMSP